MTFSGVCYGGLVRIESVEHEVENNVENKESR